MTAGLAWSHGRTQGQLDVPLTFGTLELAAAAGVFGPMHVANSPLLTVPNEVLVLDFVDSLLFISPLMSESLFQAVGEDAEIHLRWLLPVRSLHFSKGNINRALFECLIAISFLVAATKRNRNSHME